MTKISQNKDAVAVITKCGYGGLAKVDRTKRGVATLAAKANPVLYCATAVMVGDMEHYTKATRKVIGKTKRPTKDGLVFRALEKLAGATGKELEILTEWSASGWPLYLKRLAATRYASPLALWAVPAKGNPKAVAFVLRHADWLPNADSLVDGRTQCLYMPVAPKAMTAKAIAAHNNVVFTNGGASRKGARATLRAKAATADAKAAKAKLTK